MIKHGLLENAPFTLLIFPARGILDLFGTFRLAMFDDTTDRVIMNIIYISHWAKYPIKSHKIPAMGQNPYIFLKKNLLFTPTGIHVLHPIRSKKTARSPEAWNHENWIRDIIPIAGRKIQVSELLLFTQNICHRISYEQLGVGITIKEGHETILIKSLKSQISNKIP